jgi:hypothetical protein
MVNVKNKYIPYLYSLFIIIYVGFLVIDHNYSEEIKNYELKLELDNINKFIDKHKKIDAIILGGSNSAQGLSAQLLSEITNKKFYNLSLAYEGRNRFDYYNLIVNKTANIDRNNVRLIIYSTLRFFINDEIENNIYNFSKTNNLKFFPERKVISIIKLNVLSFINNYIPERKVFDKLEHGDKKIQDSFNSDLNSFKFNTNMPFKLIIDDILLTKKAYTKLFPNAIFVLVTPTIYNENPEFQNNFSLKLANYCQNNSINLITQHPITDFKPIWRNETHLNLKGRQMRTNNLHEILQKTNFYSKL